MNTASKRSGPWSHRFLIWIFSFILTLLLIFLLGYILRDIERISGPDYQAIEAKHVDQESVGQLRQIEKETLRLETQISNQREVQQILQTSAENAQQTMNQLLDNHRRNLDSGVKPTEAEQNALAESQSLFLDNQKKFQEANQVISQLSQTLRDNQDKALSLNEELGRQRQPAQAEYQELYSAHRFKIASLKMSFLIPLLFLSFWFLLKLRGTSWSPLVYSAFIAAFFRTGLAMHEHFPREFFRYIAIGAGIVIVLSFLVHLIRIIAAPKIDWLLKQYKEAYDKNRCPVCSYPVAGGKQSWLVWKNAGEKGARANKNAPHFCPSCGARIFEECAKCQSTRPALLPFCPDCGEEKIMDDSACS